MDKQKVIIIVVTIIVLIAITATLIYLFSDSVKKFIKSEKFGDTNFCPDRASIVDKNKADSDTALTYLAAKYKLSIPNIPTVANAIPDCNNTNAFDLSHPLNLIEIMYMTEVDRIATPKSTAQALHARFMEIFSSVPTSDRYSKECKAIVDQINSYYASNINKSAMRLFASGIKVALPTRYSDIAIIPRNTPVANRLDMIVKNLAIGCVDKELLLLCILLSHLYATGDITQTDSTNLKSISDIINIINGKMGTNPAIPANDKKLSLALLLFKDVNNEFKLQFNKSINCSNTPCTLEEYVNIYNQYMSSSNDSAFNTDYNTADISNNLKILNISDVKFKTSDLVVSSTSCQTPPTNLAKASKCNQFTIAKNLEQTYLDSNYDKCMDCNSENKTRDLSPNDPIPSECLEIKQMKPRINSFIVAECGASSAGASSAGASSAGATTTTKATTATTTTKPSGSASTNATTTTTKPAGSASSSTTTTTKKSHDGSSGDEWDPNSDEQPDDNNSSYNDYMKSLYGNSFDTNGTNSNWVNGGFDTANSNKLDTSTFNINDIGSSLSGITGQILTSLGYAGFNPDETTKISRTYDNIEAGYSAGLSYPGSTGTSGNSGLGAGYPLSFSYSGGIGKHSSSVIQKDFNGVSNVFAPNIIFAGNGSPDLPSHIRAPKSSKTMST